MPFQAYAQQRTDEYRRYFPDWTHRSLRAGQEREADHNSYLAGGYAEEFGYLARAGSHRGVPLIVGDSADDDALRLVQWAGMHPGYPLRPCPIAVEREKAVRRRTRSASSSGMSRLGEPGVKDYGRFVRITERPYEREHRRPVRRLAAAATRFLAATIALRWQLPSPRKGHE